MTELTRNLAPEEIQESRKPAIPMGEWMRESGFTRFRCWQSAVKQNSDIFPSIAAIQPNEHKEIFFTVESLTETELLQPVWIGNYDFWAAPAGRNKGGLQQDVFCALLD